MVPPMYNLVPEMSHFVPRVSRECPANCPVVPEMSCFVPEIFNLVPQDQDGFSPWRASRGFLTDDKGTHSVCYMVPEYSI
jgi:hypothetical protein